MEINARNFSILQTRTESLKPFIVWGVWWSVKLILPKKRKSQLNISARGFWQAGQMAFLDVRVFNTNAKRYANMELSKAYEINEKKKKKTYNERVIQVEHGRFTALVMSATGGMSHECKEFYSHLAEMICEKRKTNCNVGIAWIRRKSCIFINKINRNMLTWKPFSFSEWQLGGAIKRGLVNFNRACRSRR